MHMKVIYATRDTETAKQLNALLANIDSADSPDEVLANALNIDDEELELFIPNADYITACAESLKPDKQDTINFISEYFNNEYFTLKHFPGTNYISAIQSPLAIKKYTENTINVLNEAVKYSQTAQYPVTDPHCSTSIIKQTNDKNAAMAANRLRLKLHDLMNITNYSPLVMEIFYNKNINTFSLVDQFTDAYPKVTATGDTWYIFPELISDYHC